jgi:hypothetical protein
MNTTMTSTPSICNLPARMGLGEDSINHNRRRQAAPHRGSIRAWAAGLLTLLGLSSADTLRAQLIAADSFTYPDGALITATGSPWVNNYPPAGQADVLARALHLTQAETESVRLNFPASISGGRLYAGFKVKFSALPQNAGNFFAFFRVTNLDNLRARVWARTNGAAAGKFRLGITTIHYPPTMIPMDLSLGTDYWLVVRLVVTNSNCTLWINPADESDTANRADDATDLGVASFGHFGFLQTSSFLGQGGMGELTVDDLRIGRTFSEVLSQPRLTKIARTGNGVVELTALGQATTNYAVQASTNLGVSGWLTIGNTMATTNGSVQFTDTDSPNHASRFYRLVSP